jgi:hypothetical protein
MAEIHIQIRCTGDGFPSADELDQRYQLEDAIDEAGIGQIVDSGGGVGVMDVFVEVADPTAAQPAVTAIVERVGLADRATVRVA